MQLNGLTSFSYLLNVAGSVYAIITNQKTGFRTWKFCQSLLYMITSTFVKISKLDVLNFQKQYRHVVRGSSDILGQLIKIDPPLYYYDAQAYYNFYFEITLKFLAIDQNDLWVFP